MTAGQTETATNQLEHVRNPALSTRDLNIEHSIFVLPVRISSIVRDTTHDGD